jgi:hypothetical protein
VPNRRCLFLAVIPPERLRMHLRWGNYEGPHHCDMPLAEIWMRIAPPYSPAPGGIRSDFDRGARDRVIDLREIENVGKSARQPGKCRYSGSAYSSCLLTLARAHQACREAEPDRLGSLIVGCEGQPVLGARHFRLRRQRTGKALSR